MARPGPDPDLDLPERLNLRLTLEDRLRLDTHAAAEGLTPGQMARRYLRRAMREQEQLHRRLWQACRAAILAKRGEKK